MTGLSRVMVASSWGLASVCHYVHHGGTVQVDPCSCLPPRFLVFLMLH